MKSTVLILRSRCKQLPEACSSTLANFPDRHRKGPLACSSSRRSKFETSARPSTRASMLTRALWSVWGRRLRLSRQRAHERSAARTRRRTPLKRVAAGTMLRHQSRKALPNRESRRRYYSVLSTHRFVLVEHNVLLCIEVDGSINPLFRRRNILSHLTENRGMSCRSFFLLGHFINGHCGEFHFTWRWRREELMRQLTRTRLHQSIKHSP
jgi:hypothetical protein